MWGQMDGKGIRVVNGTRKRRSQMLLLLQSSQPLVTLEEIRRAWRRGAVAGLLQQFDRLAQGFRRILQLAGALVNLRLLAQDVRLEPAG